MNELYEHKYLPTRDSIMHAVKEYPEHVPIKESPPKKKPTHTKKGIDKRVLKEEEEKK